MSISTLILGTSGTGKSTSLRNMDPVSTLLIQAVKKPLPFKRPGWSYFNKETNPTGNIIVTDSTTTILKVLAGTSRQVVVIDDFQYILANEYMRRTTETGYQKFVDIGKNAWEILSLAANLADDKRVYILSHEETTDDGRTKAKTIGKMLDEKITLEGLFSIVLRTKRQDGRYWFSTQNSGSDTVKSPMDLFGDDFIDNDLAAVDGAICRYYEIGPARPANATATQNPAAAAA